MPFNESSEITASSLAKIDIDGNIVDPGNTSLGSIGIQLTLVGINKTGYIIHGAIHRSRPGIASMICHIINYVLRCTCCFSYPYGRRYCCFLYEMWINT